MPACLSNIFDKNNEINIYTYKLKIYDYAMIKLMVS